VKSTPARLLRDGHLLVDRHAVNRVYGVSYLPHNTVTVELANQITGEPSTRNLRWDEQVTTEEPFEVKIGESGKIRVELAQQRDEEDRPLYRYKITDAAAGIDHEDVDLYLGALQVPNNRKAARTLLGELQAASEAYFAGHAIEADMFPELVNAWAYEYSDQIEIAQIQLARGLER
jgi:hypothetical protein